MFVACGRYDYYMIDEYRKDDPHNATYGDPLGPFRTRKLAEKVAAAMNSAYQRGMKERK